MLWLLWCYGFFFFIFFSLLIDYIFSIFGVIRKIRLVVLVSVFCVLNSSLMMGTWDSGVLSFSLVLLDVLLTLAIKSGSSDLVFIFVLVFLVAMWGKLWVVNFFQNNVSDISIFSSRVISLFFSIWGVTSMKMPVSIWWKV